MKKIVSLKPIFDNLVIETVKAEKQTTSGIIIPESSQKQPNVAKVIEIGPTCKSEVKVGDYIVIPKNLHVTTEIEVNQVVYSIIKEENIIAIVNIEN